MTAKNANAKTWTLVANYDSTLNSLYPAGNKPITAPTLVSSVVSTLGTLLSDTYSSAVQFGAGGNGGHTITTTGAATTLTYLSGSGTVTLSYMLSRTVLPAETLTVSYTQPGAGLQAVGFGNTAVASYSGSAVTNNSTVGSLQGVVGSTHPMTLLTTTYSTLAADVNTAITANTTPVQKVRSWFVETVGSPDVYGITSLSTALLGAVKPTLTDSSQNYATWCANNTTGIYGAGGDSGGVVSGVEAFIDNENAIEAAYNGSNQQPYWAADHFYNSRGVIVDICVAYDWLNSSFTSGQKTKIMAYINNVLTQMWTTTPKCNNITINASYALMDGLNPGDNYFYGHMLATMLGYTAFGADNPSSSTWRSHFANMVQNNLAPWISNQTGGGSLEGTGYGLAEQLIYVCFDWWYRSTGEDIFAMFLGYWDKKLSYWAHAVTPDLKFTMNWGDHARESTSSMYDYYRMLVLPIMQHYPSATTSQNMKALLAGVSLPENPGTSLANCYHITNSIWDLFNTDVGITTGTVADWGLSFKDDVSGHAMIRTGWTSSDTAFYCSYGYRGEDHDHIDKGSFTVYKKSYLAADMNLNTGSGEQPYTDVTNMVNILIGGTLTQPISSAGGGTGTPPTVLFWDANTNGYWYLSVDYSPIWASPITMNKREYVLFPVGTNFVVLVFDHIVSNAAATKRWQVNTLYTPTITTTTHANDTASIAATGSVTQKLTMIEPAAPALTTTPWTAGMLTQAGDAFNNSYTNLIGIASQNSRIECSQTANDAVFLSVLDVNGCLTSAVPGTNTAGNHQVVLSFAAGGTKTVTFFEAATHITVV